MTKLVELSIDDGVGLIAFNRPDVRNAINDAMRKEFIGALEQAAADDSVRAVVLTGNGKAFCAGGDISGMKERLKAQPTHVAFNGWRRQGHEADVPLRLVELDEAAKVGCALIGQALRERDQPVIGAVAGATAAAIGSAYYALPADCPPYAWEGVTYYSCGGAYYEPQYEGDTIVYVTVPDPSNGQQPPPAQ